MFGRQVTLKLKTDSAAELTRINEAEILPILRKQKGFRDETTLIAPDRSEAIANSFWDTKADAEAYDHTAYADVLKTLSNVIDGTLTIKAFEFANSTFDSGCCLQIGGKLIDVPSAETGWHLPPFPSNTWMQAEL